MGLADYFHSVATGPKCRRELLTPLGLVIFGGTLTVVIMGGLYTDRWIGLPALLPGIVGVGVGVPLLTAGALRRSLLEGARNARTAESA